MALEFYVNKQLLGEITYVDNILHEMVKDWLETHKNINVKSIKLNSVIRCGEELIFEGKYKETGWFKDEESFLFIFLISELPLYTKTKKLLENLL